MKTILCLRAWLLALLLLFPLVLSAKIIEVKGVVKDKLGDVRFGAIVLEKGGAQPPLQILMAVSLSR